jgi:hypothetical protein
MLTPGGDRWVGFRSGEWEQEDPGRESIRDAVRRLDGKVRTAVTISIDEPYQYLWIAGGPDLFLVTGERADETILNLKNPTAGPVKRNSYAGDRGRHLTWSRWSKSTRHLRRWTHFSTTFPKASGQNGKSKNIAHVSTWSFALLTRLAAASGKERSALWPDAYMMPQSGG